MTFEQWVLARSPLPKNGTHTMTEHIMAMTMYVQGLETTLAITEITEQVILESRTEAVVVNDTVESVVITDKLDTIQMEGL